MWLKILLFIGGKKHVSDILYLFVHFSALQCDVYPLDSVAHRALAAFYVKTIAN